MSIFDYQSIFDQLLDDSGRISVDAAAAYRVDAEAHNLGHGAEISRPHLLRQSIEHLRSIADENTIVRNFLEQNRELIDRLYAVSSPTPRTDKIDTLAEYVTEVNTPRKRPASSSYMPSPEKLNRAALAVAAEIAMHRLHQDSTDQTEESAINIALAKNRIPGANRETVIASGRKIFEDAMRRNENDLAQAHNEIAEAFAAASRAATEAKGTRER